MHPELPDLLMRRLTKMAFECLWCERNSRPLHKAKANRLIDAGLAVVMQDGRCVLTLRARDTLAEIKRRTLHEP